MNKILSVRLQREQIEKLHTIATFDGVAIAEEVREAIELLFKSKARDPRFEAKIRLAYENARKVLRDAEGGEAVLKALGEDPTRSRTRPQTKGRKTVSREPELVASAVGRAPRPAKAK